MSTFRLWGALLATIPLLAFAQPVIQQSNAPSPGHAWTVHELQGLPPLASGPNATWDLSAATVTATRQLQLAEPGTAPGAASFPLATVVAFADNGPPYTFARLVSGQLRTLGVMTTSPLVYSDPLVTMVFPCTYGTSWTDTYAHPEEQGTRSYLADGYGTLIGSSGSVPDVLKIHSAYFTLDTVINGVTYQGLMEEDVFWHGETPWPMVTAYWYRVFVGGQLTQELRVGASLDQLFSGITDRGIDGPRVRAWPNPTQALVFIAVDRPGTYVVSCTDLGGKVLHEERVWAASDAAFTISMDGLAPGLYLLRLTGEDGAVTTVRVVRH